MNKPITVAKEEFVASLRDLINDSGLAPIILEPILKEFYSNVKSLYTNQLEADKKKYYMFLNKSVESNEEE